MTLRCLWLNGYSTSILMSMEWPRAQHFLICGIHTTNNNETLTSGKK